MGSLFKGVLLASGALLLAVGCSKPMVRCPSPGDSPQHHYLAGMEFLEEGKLVEAASKFERASFCDEKYGPAHAGAALAGALMAKELSNTDYQKADLEKARAHLVAARKNSSTPEDRFAFHVASMRIETALKQGDWLEEVEDGHKAARKLKTDEEKLLYYRVPEAADYFMGAAYLEAGEFQMSRDNFGAVLNARSTGKWHGPADRAWKRTDKVVRATSGMTLGDAGKRIAVREKVTRAEMAALLVNELGIDKLVAGKISAKPDGDGFVPIDLLSNPFRIEAATLIKWSVRGLEPSYDASSRAYLFRPDEPVKRKEFAMVLEDVIIKLTGDEKTASAFLGHRASPFPDIEPSSVWYNAAMSVTTRNMMETELTGEFRPDDAVDGAEAVMAIRALKYRLSIN
ncbi:MAG: S-layer homology domain-containing protein [Deltaproteobacteria bacterium]|nr:S-layer homology domain-containing protein [Deltaproteobacteria bacterium]